MGRAVLGPVLPEARVDEMLAELEQVVDQAEGATPVKPTAPFVRNQAQAILAFFKCRIVFARRVQEGPETAREQISQLDAQWPLTLSAVSGLISAKAFLSIQLREAMHRQHALGLLSPLACAARPQMLATFPFGEEFLEDLMPRLRTRCRWWLPRLLK